MKTIVIDCETTSLTMPSVSEIQKQPHIIEFACAVLINGQLVGEHSWLINPGEPVTEEITKITGITNEMLSGKPRFSEVLPDIITIFQNCDQVVAHNAPFDKACVDYELQRANCADFPWPDAIICTVQEYAHELGRRFKLTELYQRKLGRELVQTHRALGDVHALVEIVVAENLA